jgi:hypothetical protein
MIFKKAVERQVSCLDISTIRITNLHIVIRSVYNIHPRICSTLYGNLVELI